MYEFLANPPWWIVLILSIALAKLWDKLESGVKSLASYCMTHATGKLKRYLMGRKIKHLHNIKANRFSQLSIIRLTIKSYAYLTLFVICALVALLTAYALQAVIPQHTKILTPALAFIMCTTLLFEVLWLHTASKVSDLIKYNKKIRKAKGHLRNPQTPIQTSKSEEPKLFFHKVIDRISAISNNQKGVIIKYEKHQREEAVDAEKELIALGFRVKHLREMGALMVHHPN